MHWEIKYLAKSHMVCDSRDSDPGHTLYLALCKLISTARDLKWLSKILKQHSKMFSHFTK